MRLYFMAGTPLRFLLLVVSPESQSASKSLVLAYLLVPAISYRTHSPAELSAAERP
jgi:hypothetical protein